MAKKTFGSSCYGNPEKGAIKGIVAKGVSALGGKVYGDWTFVGDLKSGEVDDIVIDIATPCVAIDTDNVLAVNISGDDAAFLEGLGFQVDRKTGGASLLAHNTAQTVYALIREVKANAAAVEAAKVATVEAEGKVKQANEDLASEREAKKKADEEVLKAQSAIAKAKTDAQKAIDKAKADAQRQVDDLTAKLAAAQKALDKAERDLKTAKAKAKTESSDHKDLERQISALESELLGKRKVIAELKRQLRDAKDENSELRQEIVRLKAEEDDYSELEEIFDADSSGGDYSELERILSGGASDDGDDGHYDPFSI